MKSLLLLYNLKTVYSVVILRFNYTTNYLELSKYFIKLILHVLLTLVFSDLIFVHFSQFYLTLYVLILRSHESHFISVDALLLEFSNQTSKDQLPDIDLNAHRFMQDKVCLGEQLNLQYPALDTHT